MHHSMNKSCKLPFHCLLFFFTALFALALSCLLFPLSYVSCCDNLVWIFFFNDAILSVRALSCFVRGMLSVAYARSWMDVIYVPQELFSGRCLMRAQMFICLIVAYFSAWLFIYLLTYFECHMFYTIIPSSVSLLFDIYSFCSIRTPQMCVGRKNLRQTVTPEPKQSAISTPSLTLFLLAAKETN